MSEGEGTLSMSLTSCEEGSIELGSLGNVAHSVANPSEGHPWNDPQDQEDALGGGPSGVVQQDPLVGHPPSHPSEGYPSGEAHASGSQAFRPFNGPIPSGLRDEPGAGVDTNPFSLQSQVRVSKHPPSFYQHTDS